jgi:hypothetical protein
MRRPSLPFMPAVSCPDARLDCYQRQYVHAATGSPCAAAEQVARGRRFGGVEGLGGQGGFKEVGSNTDLP